MDDQKYYTILFMVMATPIMKTEYPITFWIMFGILSLLVFLYCVNDALTWYNSRLQRKLDKIIQDSIKREDNS